MIPRSRRYLRLSSMLFAVWSACCVPPHLQAQSSTANQNSVALNQVNCSDPANSNLPQCQQQYAQPAAPNTFQPPYAATGTTLDQPAQSQLRRPPGQTNTGFNNQPPERPTEFQRFVSEATGLDLPIFGSDLFRNAPTTFAPADNIPVTPDYTIGPGDELLLQAWGQLNFNLHLIVDRTGQINIPQVGVVRVAGLHFSQLQSFLKTQISRTFRNFDLNVNMGQLRSIDVLVVGQARRPGNYTISSLSTLVNALFASGGPSNIGSMRHIQLRRSGEVVTDFDLYDLLIRGDKSKDVSLLPGDVIFIPVAGPRVAVYGSLDRPAIYELSSTANTASDLLQTAGGLSALASGQRAVLERIQKHDFRHSVEITLDPAGLAIPLQDGDILRIFSIVPRFDNGVTLRGNVANPGRYAWQPGMHIRDLIPDKEALLTRDYWTQRNRLGLPSLRYQPEPGSASELAATHQAEAAQEDRSAFDSSASSTLSQSTASQNYSTAVGQNTPPSAASSPSSPSFPSAASQQPTQAAQAPVASSLGPGADQQNATAPMPSVFPVRNTVQLPEPEIDWEYAVIERVNPVDLTTSLVPFSLRRAVMEEDASQNLELQQGDVVVVFSQADIRVPQMQQTKFVRLEGEFLHAGVYSVQPAETLRQLVTRAGGISPQAYLFGSSFTRESTRQQQQARLDEFTAQLEQQVELNAANKSASIINGNEAATLGSSLDSQRNLATKLRQVRASGRIVLNIAPEDNGITNIPDLPLEDGDRFIVPTVPSNVTVVGAVYDQNSFLWKRGSRVGDFLHLSGGSNQNADRRHMFVIRADGSVASKNFTSGKFSSSFESLRIHPGDTLVVPDNINKTSFLRALSDYSSVFAGLGLGVASLYVISH